MVCVCVCVCVCVRAVWHSVDIWPVPLMYRVFTDCHSHFRRMYFHDNRHFRSNGARAEAGRRFIINSCRTYKKHAGSTAMQAGWSAVWVVSVLGGQQSGWSVVRVVSGQVNVRTSSISLRRVFSVLEPLSLDAEISLSYPYLNVFPALFNANFVLASDVIWYKKLSSISGNAYNGKIIAAPKAAVQADFQLMSI